MATNSFGLGPWKATPPEGVPPGGDEHRVVQADYAILEFNSTVGMSGTEQTAEQAFEVEGHPSDAYLELRVQDLQVVEPPIEVLVNEHVLVPEHFDPAGSDRYQTLFLRLPEGSLSKGNNKVSVRRRFYSPDSADSVLVLWAIVHWRQSALRSRKTK